MSYRDQYSKPPSRRFDLPAGAPPGATATVWIIGDTAEMPVNAPGIRKSLKVKKFIEMPGGRRLGDRIAYVTRPEVLAREAGPLEKWQEDRSFDERTALRDGSGLTQLLDLARQHGVALCIKG